MDKKEEIVLAMGQLFSKMGYSASIADLAKAVGLKPSSIYSHFESKDQMIQKFFELEVKTFYELFEIEITNLKNLNCEESLKKLYFFFFNYYKGNEKAPIWVHAAHIPHTQLKELCMELKKETDRKVGIYIQKIFTDGVINKEIKGDNLEGSIRLYNSSISGNIITLGFNHESVEFLDKLIETIWNAYWQSIKI